MKQISFHSITIDRNTAVFLLCPTIAPHSNDYLFPWVCIHRSMLQVFVVPLKKGNRLYSYNLSRIYSIPHTIQPTTSPCQAHFRPAVTIPSTGTARKTATSTQVASIYIAQMLALSCWCYQPFGEPRLVVVSKYPLKMPVQHQDTRYSNTFSPNFNNSLWL